MKKQELIHIHGLLAEVQNQYEMRSGRSTDLSEYEEVGVNPTSIHHSKTAHQEAIFALMDRITDTMTTEEEQLTSHAN
jgi:hypothetical protein